MVRGEDCGVGSVHCKETDNSDCEYDVDRVADAVTSHKVFVGLFACEYLFLVFAVNGFELLSFCANHSFSVLLQIVVVVIDDLNGTVEESESRDSAGIINFFLLRLCLLINYVTELCDKRLSTVMSSEIFESVGACLDLKLKLNNL